MSQIKATLYVSVLAFSLCLSGCGDTNSKVVFYPESGKHMPGWASGHQNAARAETESCFECHGDNLDGGIAKVSCTQCHASAGGVHPAQWGQYAYARHKPYLATNSTASCANAACHGTALTGGSGSSCATACHMGGPLAKHPAWSSHGSYAKSNGISGCNAAKCHGTDYKGFFLSGPSCEQCHLGGITAVHPATADWRNTDHKAYVLTGLTIAQTRAKCDVAACHGTFNDATKPGQIKVDKSCGAGSCHAGDKN